MKRGIIAQPISLKLFAHINNDAHLVGQSYLEGHSLSETSKFLAKFIHDASSSKRIPNEISQRLNESGIEAKLRKLSSLSEAINSGHFDPVPVAREIVNIPNGNDDNSVFFLGGWNAIKDSGQSGHAMVYEFRKDQAGNLMFLIYNSGAGLNYHIQIPSQDKMRYLPVKAYRIPKSDVTQENVTILLNELVKPRIEPLQSNEFYDQEKVYCQVIPKVALLGGVEIDPRHISLSFNEINTMGQRSGTCAEKVLHQLLKGTMRDRKSLKQFMFYFKKYTIESYLMSPKLSQDEAQQIKLAIENLARIIKKNPEYFAADEIAEAHEFIASSERRLSELVKETPAAPISYAISADIESIKTPTPIVAASITPPLEFVPASKATVVSEFYHDKLPILNELIKRPLIDVLNNVTKEIEKIIAVDKKQNPNPFVKEQIENLLLAIPLEAEYYESIKDPSQALEILSVLTKLIQLYVESCSKVEPQLKLNTNSIVALMSAFSIVHQLTRLPNVGIKRCGIAGVLMNNSYSEMVAKLMSTHLFASKNPLIQTRMKAIISIDYNVELKSNNGLDFYKSFLKEAKNKKFEKELSQLYKTHARRKLEPGYDDIIASEGIKKEMAFVLFLNDDTCSAKFSDYLINHKIEKEAVNIAYQLASLMAERYPSEASKLNEEGNFWIKMVDANIFGRKTINYNPEYGIKWPVFELYAASASRSLEKEDFSLEKDYIKTVFYNSDVSYRHVHKISEALSESKKIGRNILYHPNAIYSYKFGANAEGVEPAAQTDKERAISKMLWSLRTTKATQIVSSIDFFYSNMELLNDRDYQSYLEKNIFEMGVLLDGLVKNKE